MPAPATVDDLLELIRKSQQVDPDHLDRYLRQRRENDTLPPDPRKLAALLVRDGVLTNFQAEQFLQGRYRGFVLGGYRILERLGTGGSGTVYLAEHQVMRRRVAIKVLPPFAASDQALLERFRREAQAVAALDHPHIVRAYDFRQEGPLHFLVMEYIHGENLHDRLKREGPLPVALACEYARQAALGLEHAFEHGLVHRDVKPGNLLVDKGGTVKILDLGLARYCPDGKESLTRQYDENSVMGTADYLAPEQALNLHDVDTRADVYSLGATLYALLAGEPPFHQGTVTQKLLWHQIRQPRPIREVRPEVPEGVAAVVAKMMAKDPADRYQTPAEVAEALAPWAAGQAPQGAGARRPVSSGPTPPPPPGGRERTPAPGAVVRARRPARAALPARPVPDVSRDPDADRTWALVIGGVVLSLGLVLAGAALVFVFRDSPPPPAPAGSGEKTRAQEAPAKRPPPEVARAPAAEETNVFLGRIDKGADRVAFSPDGKWVLAAGLDNSVRLWEALGRKPVATFSGHTGPVHYVAFSPDGTKALSSSSDLTVRLWEVPGGRFVREFKGHEKLVWCAVFSPDAKQVLSGSEDGTVRLWDAATGKQLHKLEGHNAGINSVAFAPRGPRLGLSAGWDNTVRVWDLDAGKEVRTLAGHTKRATTVIFTPDAKQAVSGADDGTIRVWDVGSGKQLYALTGHSGAVWIVAVSADGQRLLSGGDDQTVRLWDLKTHGLLQSFRGHTGGVTGVAFCPTRKELVSSSLDGTIRQWRLP
jgi:WD40 repeat protein